VSSDAGALSARLVIYMISVCFDDMHNMMSCSASIPREESDSRVKTNCYLISLVNALSCTRDNLAVPKLSNISPTPHLVATVLQSHDTSFFIQGPRSPTRYESPLQTRGFSLGFDLLGSGSIGKMGRNLGRRLETVNRARALTAESEFIFHLKDTAVLLSVS
jgi:hypothetical protein